MLAFKILCILKCFLLVCCDISDPVVTVPNGVLQGSWKISADGRNYANFQGIPYAQPPIGENRFKDPKPMKDWNGIWYAHEYISSCLQYDGFTKTVYGSEDCLFLNVYTPRLDSNASLPVVVYIHGGGFLYGGSNLYDPSFLMDRDIVVVTLNYRLGPLGFISTSDNAASGNFGLKDQALGLRWVKDNIKLFGGNSDNITLTGESAGGASVHYHFLSNLSKGLFIRGIAYSGSAFAPWTFATKPAEKAKNLANLVGCPTLTSDELINCLRHRNGHVIVTAQIKMFTWKVHLFTPFLPTIESPDVEKPFLTQHPYEASQSGAMCKLPLITSVTAQEGLYPAAAYQADSKLLPELEERWSQLSSNIFEYNDTLASNLHQSVAVKIKQHYLNGKPVSQETYPQLVQALGDRHFIADVGRMAEIHARESGQPTYVYKYAFRGQRSLSELLSLSKENYGVSHGDDLLHIFKSSNIDSTLPEDIKMKKILIDMLVSFASTGVPKLGDNIQWTPVSPGSKNISFLEISSPDKMEMKSSSDFGQRSFWDSFGFNENQNYRSDKTKM